jgi:hypothetical protein
MSSQPVGRCNTAFAWMDEVNIGRSQPQEMVERSAVEYSYSDFGIHVRFSTAQ